MYLYSLQHNFLLDNHLDMIFYVFGDIGHFYDFKTSKQTFSINTKLNPAQKTQGASMG